MPTPICLNRSPKAPDLIPDSTFTLNNDSGNNDSGLIIDTDPGVDDAIAILMALASESTRLLGLTVVGGNVPLARGVRNALAILDRVRRGEVPVCRGSSRPLTGRFGYSVAFHGKSGLTRRLPGPQTRPSTENAAGFLARNIQGSPGGVSLVALGPLSNLAQLAGPPSADSGGRPNPLEPVASLTVMGGAVDCPGNVTPYAEFNFHSDPLAAHRVLNCSLPITLVDLAACRQVALSKGQVDRLRADSPLGSLAIDFLKGWFRRAPHRDSFEFYDPLALAAALDPRMVATRRVGLRVEHGDPTRWGQSSIVARSGDIALVTEVDREGFFNLLTGLLGWTGLDLGNA